MSASQQVCQVEPAVTTAPPLQPQRRQPPGWLVIAAFGAVYIIWGSTYLGIRLAIDSMPPLLMAGSRAGIAGLILYVFMRASGASRPQLRHWKESTIVGGLLLFAGNGGVSYAELTVPSNVTALMVAAVPLWMNLIDWLRPRGTRPHGGVFAGLALGFVGVALIVFSKDGHGHQVVPPLGACVLLVAPFCWALGSIYSRHAVQTSSALLNIAMQMIGGGTIMMLAGFALGEANHFRLAQITPTSAWAFAYLTFIGSLVGFTAYVWLLQVSTPAKVSTYAYVNPLVAVLLGSLFLNESLPPGLLMAGALIIGAVVLITTAKARQQAPAPAVHK